MANLGSAMTVLKHDIPEELHLTTFGQFIKKTRKNLKLTQTQLAEKCGVSQALISKTEADNLSPTFGFAIILSRTLGVTLRDLGKHFRSKGSKK